MTELHWRWGNHTGILNIRYTVQQVFKPTQATASWLFLNLKAPSPYFSCKKITHFLLWWAKKTLRSLIFANCHVAVPVPIWAGWHRPQWTQPRAPGGSSDHGPLQWPTWDENNILEYSCVLWVINIAQMFLIYINSVDYYCSSTMLIWWFLYLKLEDRNQGDVIKQAWYTFGGINKTNSSNRDC